MMMVGAGFLHCVIIGSSTLRQGRRPAHGHIGDGRENHPQFPLRRDAPVGWLVADLRQSLLAADDEQLRLLPSPHHRRFLVNDLGQVVTVGDPPPAGTRFPLYIVAKRSKFQRVLSIYVEVVERPFKFFLDHYKTVIASNAESGTQLLFSSALAIKGTPPEGHRVRFAPISSIAGFPLKIISREDPKGQGFAQIELSGRPSADGPMEFYLGAFDLNGVQLANCKITVVVQEVGAEPPKFDASHYFTSLSKLDAYKNVMRVHARAPKSTITYHLSEENAAFDIAPFSGDIFTTSAVPPGKYELLVVAKNKIGQESSATVTVLVEDEKKNVTSPPIRLRRHLSDPIVIRVKENELKDFPKLIPLFAGEDIVDAPIVREHLTVLGDGTVKVTKPINYETTRHLSVTVQIDGKRRLTIAVRSGIEPIYVLRPMTRAIALDPQTAEYLREMTAASATGPKSAGDRPGSESQMSS
ncbi:unnamed protein product [Nippostrongylus brasiliensis]|uniref:Cadherin domain-containing protein n=1 Tax=Nippostrongylus brasiliensis TaxID=27835 RepID=A0A158QXR5_NIPBR|nr:unnamed protein product [Nippostrongylus brasiliensis]